MLHLQPDSICTAGGHSAHPCTARDARTSNTNILLNTILAHAHRCIPERYSKNVDQDAYSLENEPTVTIAINP